MAPSGLAPTRRNVVVMGASAGGVEALLGALDTQVLEAAVLIVLHLAGDSHTLLPEILSRRTGMQARLAIDGDPLEAGRIVVAPPDHHLVIDDGAVRLWRGPRENRSRPAIDPLFRSAAAAYGPRVVGVILSGVLDDGSAGLAAVRAEGGLAVIQDPDDAMFSQMPRSALSRAGADHIVPLADICALLRELTEEEVTAMPDHDDPSADPEASAAEVQTEATSGTLTGLTCPECGGALWEHVEGSAHSYRCRVGHAYAPESLRAAQVESVENALWAAMRALEEQAAMSRRSAERLTSSSRFRARLLARADESMAQAEIVRSFIAGVPEAADNAPRVPQT
jgi:two-component system, chemotaxis family, protein-glutamate methylesterase/glutaminase